MSEATKHLFKLANIFAQKLSKFGLRKATVVLDSLPPNVRMAVWDLITLDPDILQVSFNPGMESQQAQILPAIQSVVDKLFADKKLPVRYKVQSA